MRTRLLRQDERRVAVSDTATPLVAELDNDVGDLNPQELNAKFLPVSSQKTRDTEPF